MKGLALPCGGGGVWALACGLGWLGFEAAADDLHAVGEAGEYGAGSGEFGFEAEYEFGGGAGTALLALG